MDENQQLIEKFYTCFKNKDYKGMHSCYASTAVFNDPIFTNLDAQKIKAMWQMLLSSSNQLSIEYSLSSASEKFVYVHWNANYTFSKTGKKVINRIKATFEIENGKIIRHTDNFNFYNWVKQALGLPGLLLGWTNFMKYKVRNSAKQNLIKFMKNYP